MEPAEIREVEPDVESVACDGGGGALGHPRVYLTFGDEHYVDCYYCGRRYIKRLEVKAAAAA